MKSVSFYDVLRFSNGLKTECSTKEGKWESLWCDIQVVKHRECSAQKQNFSEVNSVIFVFRFLFYGPTEL